MDEALIGELARAALVTALTIGGPLLGVGLLVGLLIAVLQAATQINEMTLTFVPKLMAMVIVLALFGPWMLNSLVAYTAGLLSQLATMVR
jgi:flagellar biosynthetic protein FliQ